MLHPAGPSREVAGPEPSVGAEIRRYCPDPRSLFAGHRLEILVDGAAAFPAMLDAIRGARSEILLEVYIWRADRTGRRFAAALADKARSGTSVRVVVDGLGTFWAGDELERTLRPAGVHFARFHPLRPWRKRWGWSVRDHRKLLLVDGAVAFVGGLNIGDEYAPEDWGGNAWHDVMVRVEGSAVGVLEGHFFNAWAHATGDRAVPAPRPLEIIGAPGDAHVEVLSVGRRRDRRWIRRRFLHAVRHARQRVYVEAAYFIPDRGWQRQLRNAARRGIDVRVVLPGRSDVTAVQNASRATYHALLRDGVQVYEWLPTMLHAKVLVVDDCWCSVGSYNLDQRSLLLNWEIAIAVIHGPTAAALLQHIEADLGQSRRIDLETWARRGWRRRLKEWFFYLFRGFL